ncbi:hypothetical protein ACQ0QQ_17450 [Lysinibacillus sphaericus]
MLRVLKTKWHTYWYLTFNYKIHQNQSTSKQDRYTEKSRYHGDQLLKCLDK